MATEDSTYLDYETFLDPTFSPTTFANTLVLATNNASDTPLDLTTPLSRVLFDVQEVDTHIDSLTSTSAISLLSYTKENVGAGNHVARELEVQLANLRSSYERLEREVLVRWEKAEGARLASERLLQTVRLGRAVGRCITLGRQLEAQMIGFSDFKSGAETTGNNTGDNKEDYRAMVRGANTVLSLRQVFATAHAGGEGEGLDRIHVVRSMKAELVEPASRNIIARAEQIISQFSMSTLTAQTSLNSTTTESSVPPPLSSSAAAVAARGVGSTYAQTESTRTRATSALMALYLLSPVSSTSSYSAATPTTPRAISSSPSVPAFDASLLVSALQEYLRRSITSSLAGLSSALATLPKLDRTLLEVSARCQNIVALEILLESIKPPPHLLLSDPDESSTSSIQGNAPAPPANLLQPVLHSLDTPSLPSYFWRSMASRLSSRVQKILKDGGVSARTLRSNRERVSAMIRECVNRGSQMPANVLARGKGPAVGGVVVGNWEREAAVMVGSVVNVLGR